MPITTPSTTPVSIREFPSAHGVTFRIAERIDGRHAVTLRDDDTGLVLPTVIAFDDAAAAERYVTKPGTTLSFYL